MIGLELDPAPLIGTMLASLRVGMVLLLVPMLGGGIVPAKVRVLLAFAIGFCFVPKDLVLPDEGPGLALSTLRELGIGASIGLVCRIMLTAPLMAGDMVAQELGLRMAQDVDPSVEIPATSAGRLYELAVLLAFLGAQVHRDVVGALHRSFESQPLGASSFPISVPLMTETLRETLRIALQMALPMFAVLSVSTVVLAVVARAVPQLHVMNFGFALRMLGGLAALVLLFPWIAPPAESLLDSLRRQMSVAAGG